MPPRFSVDELPDEQYQFVIQAVINGHTDRAVCAAFEKEFGEKLAKSSLNRWRNASGEHLATCYRQLRYQATQLLESLDQTKGDKFDFLMATIEDRLLAQMAQDSARDPLKLFAIRQREGERRLRQQTLDLKQKEFEFKSAEARHKRHPELEALPVALDTARFMLFWLKKRKPELLDTLVECGEDMLFDLQKQFLPPLNFEYFVPHGPMMPHDDDERLDQDPGQAGQEDVNAPTPGTSPQ